MRIRPGFARLLPLMVLTGLAAGTIALLVSVREVRAPTVACSLDASAYPAPPVAVKMDAGCSAVFAPMPMHRIHDSTGRLWELGEIPGQEVRGLELPRAQWAGIDLHDATLIACNFRGCDLFAASLPGATLTACEFRGGNLGGAILRSVTFWECDLRGADLTDADLAGATYDRFTRWPAGFEPQAHGARMEK